MELTGNAVLFDRIENAFGVDAFIKISLRLLAEL